MACPGLLAFLEQLQNNTFRQTISFGEIILLLRVTKNMVGQTGKIGKPGTPAPLGRRAGGVSELTPRGTRWISLKSVLHVFSRSGDFSLGGFYFAGLRNSDIPGIGTSTSLSSLPSAVTTHNKRFPLGMREYSSTKCIQFLSSAVKKHDPPCLAACAKSNFSWQCRNTHQPNATNTNCTIPDSTTDKRKRT